MVTLLVTVRRFCFVHAIAVAFASLFVFVTSRLATAFSSLVLATLRRQFAAVAFVGGVDHMQHRPTRRLKSLRACTRQRLPRRTADPLTNFDFCSKKTSLVFRQLFHTAGC